MKNDVTIHGYLPAGSDATVYGNPLLEALVDLVSSYDDETQMVSLVAMRNARQTLGLR